MNKDLIDILYSLGIEINEDDINTILKIGIDNYLNAIRFSVTEETLSGVYIILNEMKSQQ